MKFLKGGPGSGRKPGGGDGSRIPSGTKPRNEEVFNISGGKPAHLGPGRASPSGQRSRDLYPHGRNTDGTPRTLNDIRDTSKPIGSTDKPKNPKR